MKGISNKKLVEVAECVLRIIRIHNGMRSRCFNPKCPAYNNYGGRGIKICEEWKNVGAFVIWSLTHGYSDDLSIDRIDVNGNYEPSNCRWATMRQQLNNTRRTLWYTYRGVKKPFSYWCDFFGLNNTDKCTVRSRLKRYSVKCVFDELVMLKKYKERMASIGIKV